MRAPADHPALDLEVPAPRPTSPRARPTARTAAASPRVVGAGTTEADVWWNGLSPDRREQIRRWITQRTQHHDHVDGQLDALDQLAKEA